MEKINGAESTGLECYNKFREERVVRRSEPLDAAIIRTIVLQIVHRQLDLDTLFQYVSNHFLLPCLRTVISISDRKLTFSDCWKLSQTMLTPQQASVSHVMV